MFNSLKKQVAEEISSVIGISSQEISPLLERPRTKEHGHLALPLFAMAKKTGQNPIELVKNFAEKINSTKLNSVEKAEPLQGFLNLTLKTPAIRDHLFSEIKKGGVIAKGNKGNGKKVIIDFASPNVAKPMHVGHLRATVIGQSLANMAGHQGYDVISVNHLGDWGTQFGKLAWAVLKWGMDFSSSDPIESLNKLYVRFHDEAKKDPELEKLGAETFKRLEDGDPEVTAVWKKIVEVSLVSYQKLFDLLRVKHSVILGESFYNDKLDDVVKRLEEKNLLKSSEGAQVVFFADEEKMPPCIIKKSDGASIYATRDLAAAFYRHEIQKGDQLLYVVGNDQALHFKQVFRVLELMGYEWAKDCHHIGFGLYRFKEGKMSTREGRVIVFQDILERALELVRGIINEKNPDLANKEEVARMVAVGALFFNDMVNERTKNVEFDWDKILSFEGDSGPYVMYTLVRCRSILRKYGKKPEFTHIEKLTSPEEVDLMLMLQQLDQVIERAYEQFRPNVLAQYLLDVCSHFSHFYHKCRVLGEAPEIESARAALVFATQEVLDQGLRLLHIETPQEM